MGNSWQHLTINSDDLKGGFRIATISINSDDVGGGVCPSNYFDDVGGVALATI